MKEKAAETRITKITIKPSQWVNIFWALLAIAGIAGIQETGNWLFAIPVAWWLWKFAVIECWQYRFDEDSETVVERKGVFSVQIVEIHYFRIKSVQIRKPFLMRLVGISIVDVITSEPFKPYLRLYAVSHGDEWAEFLHEMTRYWRNEKGVRETDFHSF